MFDDSVLGKYALYSVSADQHERYFPSQGVPNPGPCGSLHCRLTKQPLLSVNLPLRLLWPP